MFFFLITFFSTGLVTIEDVIEQIVGEIDDEHDTEDAPFIRHHPNGEYTVKAITPTEEFNEYFKTNHNEDEFDTVGGHVIKAFGYLPKRGETTNFDRFNIKVLRADKRRVNLLLFTINESEKILENESSEE